MLDFKYNLLSVTEFLTDNYCCTTFYPTHCVFQDLSTKLIVVIGKKASGLYTFDSSHPRQKASISIADISEECPSSVKPLSQDSIPDGNNSACRSLNLDVLHARLGDTSFSKMQDITECKPLLSNEFFCKTCVLAKFHRLPFNITTIATKAPFQLAHMDLWSPYRVASVTGAKYFLAIVDDFNRNIWIHML